MKKKCMALLSVGAAMLMWSPAIPVSAKNSEDIIILYTNDVHCGVDDNIGYDGLKLYKREMQAQYDNVILVDAGDAIQGAPIGMLSKGEYLTDLMNAVEYDVATIGNHEFDYGMETFYQRAEQLNCGYISSNFSRKDTGNLVVDPYKIIEAGDKKVAFVGATTPETLSCSTPTYFQNDQGEYIYTFGENGNVITQLQKSVNDALSEGADYVIVVGHLGESWVTEGWSAPEIAEQLTGVNAIIDGHSHEETPHLTVKSKDDKDVLITQTGTKLANIGKMTISSDGKISTELVTSVPAPDVSLGIATDTWLEPEGREGRYVDKAVYTKMSEINDKLGSILDQEIGTCDFDLTDSDPATGIRCIRNRETNLGDLVADGIKEILEADIGCVNGGGLRSGIKSGAITYRDILTVLPNSNGCVLAEVTGQQILDLLESGVKDCPGESGTFLHVSGASYSFDTSIPSSVKYSDTGAFIKVDGEYRVKDVKIGGEPLDLNKTYKLASLDYFLKKGGDGYILTGKSNILKDDVMADSEMLIKYITENLGGTVPASYKDPLGQGRITDVSSKKLTFTVNVSGDADITLNGEAGETHEVAYLSQPVLEIKPKDGETIKKITLNGEDITADVKDGKYTLSSATEDTQLAVVVETDALPTETESSAAEQNLVSDEEYLQWVLIDYEKRTGVAVTTAYASKQEHKYVIEVRDKDGSLVDTYAFDPKTGIGSSDSGAVNLPQTGVTSGKTAAAVGGAFTLTIAGIWMMLRAVSRKDGEE